MIMSKIMGRHGKEKWMKIGQLFANFCAENNLLCYLWISMSTKRNEMTKTAWHGLRVVVLHKIRLNSYVLSAEFSSLTFTIYIPYKKVRRRSKVSSFKFYGPRGQIPAWRWTYVRGENRPTLTQLPDLQPAEQELEINCDVP